MHELRAIFQKWPRVIGLNHAESIVGRIYNEDTIDPTDPCHNTFFHEMRPLVSIARYIGRLRARVVFCGPNAPVDGYILLGSKTRQAVEFTAAIDGYNDNLAMELVKARGSAPLFHKIDCVGSKGARIFGPNEGDAVPMDQTDSSLYESMKRRIAAKQRKARDNSLYIGAWLGAVFDDWHCDGDRQRWDQICERLLDHGASLFSPFERVFFIGMHGRYLFDSARLGAAVVGLGSSSAE